MMALPRAQAYAEKIAAELQPYCLRLEIAGSIRRQRPTVNDIDLVVELREDQREPFRRRCLRAGVTETDGRILFSVKLRSGIKLDVVFVEFPEPGLFDTPASTWGTRLLQRTGSKEHNAWFALDCQKRGLRWDPFWGIFEGPRKIAGATEQDMYRAIARPYMDPQMRER